MAALKEVIKILLTDTHFGIKQNSNTWYNYQCLFFDKQLIPCIKKLKRDGYDVMLYHLGDVFDSRSSINTSIAKRVRELFVRLSELCTIYIISGNHDYYYPDSDEINTCEIILNNINNVNIISNELFVLGEDLLAPWFEFQKFDKLQSFIQSNNIKNIYTHADLMNLSNEYNYLLKDYNVYSGHIHTPNFNRNYNTIGSVYSLSFADSNTNRGFYVVYNDNIKFINNTHSIKFYRIYNEDILKFDINGINSNDYIELYIYKENLLIDEYQVKIKKFTDNFKNCNVIPQQNILDAQLNESININTSYREYIPENLLEKFDIISDFIKYEK